MIESIMDFVFNNLFIVIIVIAIVSNLISGSKKTQRQNEQRESKGSGSSSREETQTRESETLESKIERNLKKIGNIFEEEKTVSKSKPVEKAMTSIEEQRQKQRDALANRFQTNTHSNQKDVPKQKEDYNAPTVIRHHNKKSGISKKGLKRRMSEKGLKESIVMAEVLGKPRSLKPYSSKRVD